MPLVDTGVPAAPEGDVEIGRQDSAKRQPRTKLGLLPLVALIFYEVSGGPFGTEVSSIHLNQALVVHFGNNFSEDMQGSISASVHPARMVVYHLQERGLLAVVMGSDSPWSSWPFATKYAWDNSVLQVASRGCDQPGEAGLYS